MPKHLTAAVRYTVIPHSPNAHLLRVICEIPAAQPQGERFSLPAWIPGSYMIREFAKNIVRLEARQGNRIVPLYQLDKHSWQTGPLTSTSATLKIEADIYAWDLSVRCAHLDQSHLFFNGTQVFFCIAGREDEAHEVELQRPIGIAYRNWRVATTLPALTSSQVRNSKSALGTYRTTNYDELIDHPVEMGEHTLLQFKAAGVTHEVALTGRFKTDEARIKNDLTKICAWHINFFGAPAPFKRYLFQVMVVGDGYGGLEHRSSTALICSRNDLPIPGMHSTTEAYRTFLGLCSHEYFHAWNVKRIKPQRFTPYDLGRENYTSLLWLFEGFTSYYDDLALIRCGLFTVQEYLNTLAKTISGVLKNAGRLKQSVAQSSFEAWTKYYRQDENSPNAIVSYYTKGSLIALCLDLSLRLQSRGRRSLDDVMRYLWEHYGEESPGVEEDAMRDIILYATGIDMQSELQQWVYGTQDLPLESLLSEFGIRTQWDSSDLTSALGLKTRAEGHELKLVNVFDNSVAQASGLSAGDCLVALDGIRASNSNLESLLIRYKVGDPIQIAAFRRDELRFFALQMPQPKPQTCKLQVPTKPSRENAKRLNLWLNCQV